MQLEISTNIIYVKNARAIWKVYMVQNCDNDLLEGLTFGNLPSKPKPIVS
jgi:hypothetical protein